MSAINWAGSEARVLLTLGKSLHLKTETFLRDSAIGIVVNKTPFYFKMI
jgi:hypothetical protein